MYGNRVADESASKFNVTWSRVSPVCVSLCNDYNCLYITGDSNHIMGREAVGNANSVWIFTKSYTLKSVEKTVYLNVFLGALIYYRNTTQKQPYSNYLRTKKFTFPYLYITFFKYLC